MRASIRGRTDRTQPVDEATRRAREQINATRLRAEKEMERASKQAERAVRKSQHTARENPLLLSAIAGTAIAGGVAAWFFSRNRSS